MSHSIPSFNLLVDDLADERRSHRTAAALLVVYGLLWWSYALLAKSTQDIHFDMGEVFSWSTRLAYGYPKHPPFPAWVAAFWFMIFPRTDWAYYLVSVASFTVALWFIWLIAAAVVDGDKRAVALVLLTLTPIFNLQPLKFNSNALLIPAWAFATWAFLRSYSKRTFLSGVLVGTAAAIALLTKYWSVFLILGFAVGALTDRRRRLYFSSPAPWAAMVTAAVLVAPNIVTLFKFNFQAFKYASEAHQAGDFTILAAIVSYLSSLVYLVGVFAAIQMTVKPRWTEWHQMLWPAEAQRRLWATILWTSFLSPIPIALLVRMRLHTLWAMPCWSLLPALLLSKPGLTLSRRAAVGVVATPFIVCAIALALTPLVAIFKLHHPPDNFADCYALVAREVDKRWMAGSEQPLEYVTGPDALAWGCTFYCRDRPLAFPGFSRIYAPWIDPSEMARRGFVAVCPEHDGQCLASANALAAGSGPLRYENIRVTRSLWGMEGKPYQFTLVIVPPRA